MADRNFLAHPSAASNYRDRDYFQGEAEEDLKVVRLKVGTLQGVETDPTRTVPPLCLPVSPTLRLPISVHPFRSRWYVASRSTIGAG